MTTPHTVAVLGLGRMGTAIATRLAGHGFDVVGWTRSGRRAPTAARTAAGPGTAVAEADTVILALFDGPACRTVLDDVRDALRPDTVVVNTATVAPAEAAGLAREPGPYVHAPVLGSVPAVAAGALRILAAGDADARARVRPVLDALGDVRPVRDAATAAALKLVANHSLAGAVLALRDALRQADALGLPRADALDVLELGQLAGLVARKRDVLTGAAPTAPADFTVGALAKDMALLADASGAPLRSAAGLTDAPAGARLDPAADIAVAATEPAADDAVLEPLRAYVRGHATGEPAHFGDAFLPTAHVEGLRDGRFVSWSLDEYRALFPGRPAPDEPARRRRLDAVDVHGGVATATMTLRHGADTFTDVFLLIRTDAGWRIANKAYHRHT
ncbi:nuclear transport factor 2 family protein [Streptomyces albogriseolus]|uniref:nuclear transport factor 2 family protein n=1 Tax=Streptomyces albogriseolus TaxID=1887 RepID=UPI0034607F24